MTTNNLTEQWKKGELEGEYYIETNDGKHYVCELQTRSGVKNKRLPFAKSFNGYVLNKSVVEVLAPIPSYEQWLQMKAFCEEFNALEVAEENRELKELLKKCNETFFEIRLSLASGKINSVFDLSRQRENDIKEVLNVPNK